MVRFTPFHSDYTGLLQVTNSYVEVPSNIILKKFNRPSVYLGTLVTIWGVIMTCHGVVKNFAGLLSVRLLLGVFEAGFYPGAVYLCTFWYLP